VMLEDVVLFAARALRAFKARDKQEGDTHGHECRYQIRIRRKPMNQCTHNSGENTAQIPQNRQFLCRSPRFEACRPSGKEILTLTWMRKSVKIVLRYSED
jgi:hypothetical protein